MSATSPMSWRVRVSLAPIDNVGIVGINSDVAVLEHAGQAPIAKRDFAVIASAFRGDASGFLLCAVNPVGETIVGGDVIELRGGLVVPTAPGIAAIHADGRALVGGNGNDLRIFGADPDALVIVAAGRALPAHKVFPASVDFHEAVLAT